MDIATQFEQFRDLVERMRTAQKNYFAYRQPETLKLSKELERLVDRAIEERKQPRLL